MTEGPEPDFADILGRLDTCDVVIVEGYKSQPIRKIETRRKDAKPGFDLAGNDPNVIAIASDEKQNSAGLPHFNLDAIADIADFVVGELRLVKGRGIV